MIKIGINESSVSRGGVADPFSGFEMVLGSSANNSINVCANTLDGGHDTLDGGHDTLDGGGNDILTEFANIIGSSAGDSIIDDSGDYIFSGFEYVIGSSAGDSILGNSDANFISGGPGNDALDGGHGKDTVDVGGGDDNLTGAKGIDLLSYASATAGVVVNLLEGSASGGAWADSFSGFEMVLGSSFADSFVCGGSGTITPGMGDDTINNPARIILDFQSASNPVNLGTDSVVGVTSGLVIEAVNYPAGYSCSEVITGSNSVLTLTYSGGTISVLNITSTSSLVSCSNIIWAQ